MRRERIGTAFITLGFCWLVLFITSWFVAMLKFSTIVGALILINSQVLLMAGFYLHTPKLFRWSTRSLLSGITMLVFAWVIGGGKKFADISTSFTDSSFLGIADSLLYAFAAFVILIALLITLAEFFSAKQITTT